MVKVKGVTREHSLGLNKACVLDRLPSSSINHGWLENEAFMDDFSS